MDGLQFTPKRQLYKSKTKSRLSCPDEHIDLIEMEGVSNRNCPQSEKIYKSRSVLEESGSRLSVDLFGAKKNPLEEIIETPDSLTLTTKVIQFINAFNQRNESILNLTVFYEIIQADECMVELIHTTKQELPLNEALQV